MKFDWKQYTAKQVLEDYAPEEKGKRPQRLFSYFMRDFRAVFGKDPCNGCGKFYQDFEKFIKKIEDMANQKGVNSGYKLKEMYNGIPLQFGGPYVSNANLTDELAEKLLKNHPKGTELFSEFPKEKPVDAGSGEQKSERQVELEKLKVDELKDLAANLELPATGKKAELVKAILEKENGV